MQSTEPHIFQSLDVSSWEAGVSPGVADQATAALEAGKILYAPRLPFELSSAERRFLTPACLAEKAKNISYRPDTGALRGTHTQGPDHDQMFALLRRYFTWSSALMRTLLPSYGHGLRPGFTSFRPAEIQGRAASWRQDDTRLHVDAFPSRPLQGLRILRVFTNVNPQNSRHWRVGEPFENVAAKFVPTIRRPFPASSWLLQQLRIVKGRRTEYDHFMLGIHDHMKADQRYQSEVPQTEFRFPPGVTWACYTDSVSHAAMSGQFAFEQTFYLPVDAMKEPGLSPLRILERLLGRKLV